MRARQTRKIPEPTMEPGTFPVPPLPTKETASKEKTNA